VARKKRITNSVRTHRFNAGQMTQAELAAQCGVTRQTIIAIEQGRFTPSLESAFEIARAFKVPLDEIFEYSND
jgi:putative transcriptional regulator